MMVILNLVFMAVLLIVAFAVGLVLFGAAWCLGVVVIRPKRWGRWLLAGVPIYALLFVSCLVGTMWHITRPANVFESEFGFSPPQTAQNLRSSIWSLADSGHVFLAFDASPATVQAIASQGMRLSTDIAPVATGNLTPPSWWQPPPVSNPGVEAYVGDQPRHGFANEWQLLVYDQSSQRAYWFSQGVD